MLHVLLTFARRHAIVLVLGAAVGLAGCQAAAPPPFNPDDPAIVAEIEARMQPVMAGAAAADADKVLEIAEGTGEFTFMTGDVMLSGLDTIRARFKETYAGLEKQDQTILEKRVRILSPDVALVLVVAEGTYTDKAGWTSEPVGIGTTIVFVREDGTWRARHAHQSIGY
jgi:uncharacterized protein (TIGR02246 family)